MKKIFLGLLTLGIAMHSYGQDTVFKVKIKKETVPTTIIESIDNDYGNLEIIEFYALPIEYIEEDVYINDDIESEEDYETFQVKFKGEQGSLVVTYNKEGEELSTVEHLKNVAPNIQVREAVAKSFPGWILTKDYYKMTHFANKKAKERYKLILKKGDNEKVVFMDEKGEILKVHKKINTNL
ncbi:hypothetical protein [uncultured Winogradskyella sp.]|mgnify:FL=1|uniref:hypothetical protein n=1 Tax=uncultured Winogradskyella sp. TaxID=395353 RepID=UPI0030EBCCEA|tara:strand:- start:1044 stop:1589 length:546 start_codon:yes stop_codon:yes gene_type:complete